MQLTPRCQRAVKYAENSLARFGHSHVSSAHLVLGLLTLSGGVADNLLRRAGLSVESVENYLSSRRSSAEPISLWNGVPVGSSARSAVDRAEAESHARDTTYLGIEHLLLGILAEESGEATDLFASVHIDQETMKRNILEQIQ